MDHNRIWEETTSRFEQLLTLNDRAFADGQYEVAYHALCAAMHSAVELHDLARLAAIETQAAYQGHWIDVHAPEHLISTFSAHTRGHSPLYHTLARDANYRQVLVRSEQLR